MIHRNLPLAEAALALADAAEDVVATWDQGDLASAVRNLDAALRAFDQLHRVFPIHDPVPRPTGNPSRRRRRRGSIGPAARLLPTMTEAAVPPACTRDGPDPQPAKPSVDCPAGERTKRIRDLNDRLRTTLVGGRIHITRGIDALGSERIARLLRALKSFDRFDRDNDPHGEHDFGSIEDGGETFFWKIDYYDRAMDYGSSDPADPQVTTRVLTIMLASEY